MPREIKDIKQFLSLAGRPDAKACRIKKSSRKTERGTSVTVVKFKIRCSRYLYTLVVNDAEKADKLRGSLPPTLKIEDVDKPTSTKKK